MAKAPEFTDEEIGFIQLAIGKVDPTGIMLVAINVNKKIEAYGRERQQEQMADAAKAKADEAVEAVTDS